MDFNEEWHDYMDEAKRDAGVLLPGWWIFPAFAIAMSIVVGIYAGFLIERTVSEFNHIRATGGDYEGTVDD